MGAEGSARRGMCLRGPRERQTAETSDLSVVFSQMVAPELECSTSAAPAIPLMSQLALRGGGGGGQ